MCLCAVLQKLINGKFTLCSVAPPEDVRASPVNMGNKIADDERDTDSGEEQELSDGSESGGNGDEVEESVGQDARVHLIEQNIGTNPSHVRPHGPAVSDADNQVPASSSHDILSSTQPVRTASRKRRDGFDDDRTCTDCIRKN
jgi:hypothetical protein